jgi:hypothetical protein
MGPTVSVVFERKLSIEESMELKKEIERLGLSIDFYFCFPDNDQWYFDDEEIAAVVKTTSLLICGALIISSPCNGDDDHRNLACVALIASKFLSGLVEFGGAIIPTVECGYGSKLIGRILNLISMKWFPLSVAESTHLSTKRLTTELGLITCAILSSWKTGSIILTFT